MDNEITTTLQILMFDTFQITNQTRSISESSNRSKKMWNLLGYMITHRKEYTSQEEYIDLLWPNEKSSNPTNALKTLLFRLRALLEPLALEQENFILSSHGSYQWNKNISCSIDTELFETFCKKGTLASTAEDKITFYQKALDLYKGDFLSKHRNELWVIPIATHYHNLFLETTKKLVALLEQCHQFDLMECYCNKALKIDELDEELHCLLIRCFLLQGNSIAALNHYEQATNLFYQNLGVKPSKELRKLYLEIISTQKTLETDLGVIQNDLKEAEYKPGPFLCEYCIFQETYRLIARQAAREGRSVFICLITVSESNGELPSLTKLDTAMQRLLKTICSCLRRGDVVSKYSGAQYVILLPSVTYEDGTTVMERIVKKYYQTHRKSILHLKYKLRQIEVNQEP